MEKQEIMTTKKSNLNGTWTAAAVLLFFVILSAVVIINAFISATENPKTDTTICITENSPLAADTSIVATQVVTNANQSVTPLSGNADTGLLQDRWIKTTHLDIFKQEYSNVKSDGSGNIKKVIAPGTSNDYTFSLQNSKNFNVKYSLEITGGNNSEHNIPIQLMIIDSNGASLTNGEWVELQDFDKAADTGTINSKNEKQYTIRWKWDFENGSDSYDTFLGNTSVTEEIPCHISINVIAESDLGSLSGSSNRPSFNDVIDSLLTGESGNIWAVVGVLIASGILIIILIKKKRPVLDFEESEDD